MQHNKALWGVSNISKDLDQKFFNAAVNFAHRMIDNGYARAWFSWIEWIGLTMFILLAAKKIESYLLFFVGGLSSVMLFFVALAGIERAFDDIFPLLKRAKISLIFVSAVFIPFFTWLMFETLSQFFLANVA